jgi:hypothetical protein
LFENNCFYPRFIEFTRIPNFSTSCNVISTLHLKPCIPTFQTKHIFKSIIGKKFTTYWKTYKARSVKFLEVNIVPKHVLIYLSNWCGLQISHKIYLYQKDQSVCCINKTFVNNLFKKSSKQHFKFCNKYAPHNNVL